MLMMLASLMKEDMLETLLENGTTEPTVGKANSKDHAVTHIA